MDEYVKCMICGQMFKTRITPTHLKKHNITISQYRQTYPNAKLVTDILAKRSCVTLKNQISKYGIDEGTRRFNEYVEKQRIAGVSLDYFIEKYGEIEGTAEYNRINQLKGTTLQNQILKYGLVDGTKKYNDYINKRQSSTYQKFGSSKLAERTIEYIINKLDRINVNNIKFGKNEYFLVFNNKLYFYDLTFLDKRKIIEINGDYWHANPIKYNYNDVIMYPNGYTKVVDKWEYDVNKMKSAISYGFEIYYLWEYDLLQTFETQIDKVIQWIMK